MKSPANSIEDPKLPIFISYSHADAEWLKRLSVHLRVLEREYSLDKWDDRRITAGSRWQAEIKEAIERCRVAILLVSADFLASEFIHRNELPPLLQAAEESGTVIIPIIVGPCLFSKKQEIAQFQSINPPSKSLISMSKLEQEETFVRVAERLFELIGDFKARAGNVKDDTVDILTEELREDFLSSVTATKLIKIGDWIHDSGNRQIIGAGVGSFLLSREAYGGEFSINASLSFSNFHTLNDGDLVGFNAGIVLGWNDTSEGKRYFNLLITGEKLLIEKIGFGTGDDYDFEHICPAVDFPIRTGAIVDIRIDATDDRLTISNGKTSILDIQRPLGINGRVGLRPWRSQVNCKDFVVRAKL